MPHLLAIPREIRDEIYEITLAQPLQSSIDPSLARQRLRTGPDTASPEVIHGEKQICYPSKTSLPPSHGLLLATRQLRAELLQTVKRLGPIRYKVDISSREDNGLVVPTWIKIPILTDKIDVLQVQWRFRAKKSSSVATFDGDNVTSWGCGFGASLAMLQRFVERGVYLLSKKKRKNIHIGLLAINMDTPVDMPTELAETMANDIISNVDEWMAGENFFAWDDARDERENGQFDLLSNKIGKLRFSLDGVAKKKWVLADEAEKRRELRREKEKRRLEGMEQVNIEREILQNALRELMVDGMSEADVLRNTENRADSLLDR
jgi:hypothetical protein